MTWEVRDSASWRKRMSENCHQSSGVSRFASFSVDSLLSTSTSDSVSSVEDDDDEEEEEEEEEATAVESLES